MSFVESQLLHVHGFTKYMSGLLFKSCLFFLQAVLYFTGEALEEEVSLLVASLYFVFVQLLAGLPVLNKNNPEFFQKPYDLTDPVVEVMGKVAVDSLNSF